MSCHFTQENPHEWFCTEHQMLVIGSQKEPVMCNAGIRAEMRLREQAASRQRDIDLLRNTIRDDQNTLQRLMLEQSAEFVRLTEAQRQYHMGAINIGELVRHVLNYAAALNEAALTEMNLYGLEERLRGLTGVSNG